jgi:hypothetical protein
MIGSDEAGQSRTNLYLVDDAAEGLSHITFVADDGAKLVIDALEFFVEEEASGE